MDCQRIEAIVNEHATGALSAAERSEINAHLDGCQRCADTWLSYETLNSESPEPARPGLFNEIAATLMNQPPQHLARGSTKRWASLAGLAASAVVVAILVAVLVTDDGTGLETIATGSVINGVDLMDVPSATSTPPPLPGSTEPNALLSDLVAGRDYELARNPELFEADSEQIVVCEFFMFECIFCFNLEPSFVAWADNMPDDVAVERVPALFNSLARLHAQAFYAAELLGHSEGLHMAFYQEIHDRGNRLSSVDAIREFFERNGVDGRAFDMAFASRAVELSMQRAEELNVLYGVTATPSLGVNGKYLTSPGLTGSNERMFDVVDELILREAKEQCSSGDPERCPLFE